MPSLKHAKTTAKADGPDNSLVQPSDWNAEHALTHAGGMMLGRATPGIGSTEELPLNSIGVSLAVARSAFFL